MSHKGLQELKKRLEKDFGKKSTVKEMFFITTERQDYDAEIKLMKDFPEYSFYFITKGREGMYA